MGGAMKKKSLMYESLTRFIICVAILLALATPLFYLLTKNFYAEDMIDIIEAVRRYLTRHCHTVHAYRYHIGGRYRIDDASYFQTIVAPVRQDSDGNRGF